MVCKGRVPRGSKAKKSPFANGFRRLNGKRSLSKVRSRSVNDPLKVYQPPTNAKKMLDLYISLRVSATFKSPVKIQKSSPREERWILAIMIPCTQST